MRIVDHPTRLMFFTGKGGVGKTSLACAAATALADAGRNVLLVSTDPASNLGQVFGMTISEDAPVAVHGVPGLYALNINPESAAQAYRDRVVGPVRDFLPSETIKSMEEQLSGACTTEIAAVAVHCVRMAERSDFDLIALACRAQMSAVEVPNQLSAFRISRSRRLEEPVDALHLGGSRPWVLT